MLKPQLPAIVVLFITIVTPLATGHETFQAQVVAELDKAFSAMASGPHVNAVALVDARNGHLRWARATGTANPRLGQPMTVDHQFRTASVTKTFTGVLILQLIEEGKLELDTHLHQLLKPQHFPKGRSIADLRTFIRGLFSGKLFRQPNTLNQMMSAATIHLNDPQKYFEHGESTYNLYTCGLKRWSVGSTVLWGHGGFWGIGMFYIPKSDVCIILVSNQVATNIEDEMSRFVRSLQDSGFLD